MFLITETNAPLPSKSNHVSCFVFQTKYCTIIFCFQLEYGADPSLSDNDGYTAVHLAAKDGHDGVLEKLLSTGAQLFESFIYLLLPHWYFIFMMSLEGVTLPCPFCISLSMDPFQESLEKLSHPESRSEISNFRFTKLFYLIIFHINHTRGFRCIHFSVFSYRLTENAETFPKPS